MSKLPPPVKVTKATVVTELGNMERTANKLNESIKEGKPCESSAAHLLRSLRELKQNTEEGIE